MRALQQSPLGHSAHRSNARRVFPKGGSLRLRCTATAATTVGKQAIPHELPLFPVQPVGVFLPGMTKTLHLYEPHFVSLVEECLASQHRLMATAVLEPYMGRQAAAAAAGDSSDAAPRGGGNGDGGTDESGDGCDAGPGSFVGGYNFSLSCGCLVQVLSAKPYTGGYLVRIRGEARLGISGLPQTGPYMRAQVYPLPDQAVGSEGAAGEAQLRRRVEDLRDIMRDVQNLASKFRCDETAALQQAMRWLYADPITPGIHRVSGGAVSAASGTTHGSEAPAAAAAGTTAMPTVPAGPEAERLTSASSTSQLPSQQAGTAVAGQYAGAQAYAGSTGLTGCSAPHAAQSASSSGASREGEQCPGEGAPSTTETPAEQQHTVTAAGTSDACEGPRSDRGQQSGSGGVGAGRPAPAQGQSGQQQQQQQHLQQQKPEGDYDEEAFDPEEAVRLSWAALQWLPHASMEERMQLVRSRLLAMDTRDTGTRLQLAIEAMAKARASLAAKCAIKAM